MSWCTIESDPGVFTELIQKFGVKGAHFREFYTMDEESFEAAKPLYGLIFLFRWSKTAGAVPPVDEGGPRYYDGTGEVYFANQVINNACATQAIIHILLNSDDKLDIGPTLTDFKAFTSSFPPDMAGETLNCQPAIRTAHNSFKRPEPFVFEKQLATEDDDVYHFVAYVPVGNKVFELDGLKKAPVYLGDTPAGGEWYQLAREAINRRISKAESSEIRWALMGLRQNESEKLGPQIAQYRAQLAAVNQALGGEHAGASKEEEGADDDIAMLDSSFELASTPEALEEQKNSIQAKLRYAQGVVDEEKAMMERWQQENVRRKHNYVPLAVELINILAEKKELMPMLEAGKKKAVAQREHARKRKAEREAAKASAAGDGSGSSA